MAVSLTIKGAEQLGAMARALKEAHAVGLRNELNRALRESAKPMQEAIRRGALEIKTAGVPRNPARPFRSPVPDHHTRAWIANAVTTDVRVSGDNPLLRVRVQESKLPKVLRGMPRKFDDGGTFRHPIMGNREAWAAQTTEPWFWPAAKGEIKDVRAKCDEALERVKEKLERA